METTGAGTLIIVAAVLAAALFTVAPIVPGWLFVPAAALIVGPLLGQVDLPLWFWIAQAVLVMLMIVIDHVAQLRGVATAGGHRRAMLGGAIGVVAGPLLLVFVAGPLGLVLGPPIGAAAGTVWGEWSARRATADERSARELAQLGWTSVLAYVVGTGAKLALVVVQAALLVVVAT